MTIKLGVVMDAVDKIKVVKDTTVALLLEATRRGYDLYYMQQHDIFLQHNQVKAFLQPLKVFDDQTNWCHLSKGQYTKLNELDIILMRKDPPFDMEYIYTTYLLEQVENQGVLVINKPQGLRDANEKFYVAWFPKFLPAMLVTRDANLLKKFIHKHKKIVIKPLDGMGGKSIFLVNKGDKNINVIIEVVTNDGQKSVMAQKYIDAVEREGDKRLFIINGQAFPYGLTRIPKAGEFRGNLAKGGRGKPYKLKARDFEICRAIAPKLMEHGLYFVGIDVIGDYLTEINVTSPTCVREVDAAFDVNISTIFFDGIVKYFFNSER